MGVNAEVGVEADINAEVDENVHRSRNVECIRGRTGDGEEDDRG